MTAATPAPAVAGGLKDRRLIAWLTGEALSQFGDQFFIVALAVSAVHSAGAVGAGLVLAVSALPKVCLLLFAGSLVDRIGPRCLMLGSDLARLAMMAFLALYATTTAPSTWVLAVVAATFGALDAVFEPAANTLPVHVVAEEELVRLQGLRTALGRAATIAGGPVGGLAAGFAGVSFSFAVNAATFGISAAALWWLRTPNPAPNTEPPSPLWRETTAGLRYALTHPLLRSALVLIAALEFSLTGAVNVGVPLIAEQRHWGPFGIGLVNSAFGAGAILGPLSMVLFKDRVRRAGPLVLGAAALGTVCFGIIGTTSRLSVAAAVAAGLGLTIGFLAAIVIPLIQRASDPAYLGRVMSLLALALSGLTPLSMALTGIAVGYLGAPATMAICAALAGTASLAAFTARVLRQATL
ncbi:MFS transporter [Streptomyces litmocidini]|uniref:MFS transporter n=1 Tax=Streptomyces litmocidini TaxID=67318 RepID=UPI00167EB1D7|nr:MFS transporter [Streptomyces litmocidini]GGV20484.1 MFS transporter [Streptomyces litmocidini]